MEPGKNDSDRVQQLKHSKAPSVRKQKKCSWCLEVTDHQLITKHIGLKRNKYQCQGCLKSTIRCRNLACESMSRAQRGWHEGFCIDHNPLFYKDPLVEGNCSWCFNKTSHKVQNDSLLNRVTMTGPVYACEECHFPTQKCKKCEEGMCRMSERGATSKCFSCCGLITWGDAKKATAAVTTNAWCPWCVNKTDHVIKVHLVGNDKTNRDVFRCTACSNDTKPCSCGTSMIIGTAKTATRCLACLGNGEKLWTDLKAKFDSASNKYTLDRAKASMDKSTDFKQKASDAGLVRPFLLLVSMHPSMRCATAFKLDIPILHDPCFGDDHAEANLILFHPKKGLQRRTNSIFESIGINTKCNWYQILRRAIHDLALTESTFKSKKAKDTYEDCIDPSSDVLNALEMELLDHIAKRHLQMLPAELREKAKEMYANKEIYNMFDDLHKGSMQSDSICIMFIAIIIASGVQDGKLNMNISQIHFDTFVVYLRSYLRGSSALGDRVKEAQFAGTQVAFFIARVIIVGGAVQIVGAILFAPLLPFVSAGLLAVGIGLFVAAFVFRPTREIACQATLLIVFQHFLLSTSQIKLSDHGGGAGAGNRNAQMPSSPYGSFEIRNQAPSPRISNAPSPRANSPPSNLYGSQNRGGAQNRGANPANRGSPRGPPRGNNSPNAAARSNSRGNLNGSQNRGAPPNRGANPANRGSPQSPRIQQSQDSLPSYAQFQANKPSYMNF